MIKSWKASVLIFALALCCFLSACGIHAEKAGQAAKKKALEELGKLDKNLKKSYGKDTSADKWMRAIADGAQNLYDFHDLFGKELLSHMVRANSLEPNWNKLQDYTGGYLTNFDQVSVENYSHGVIASEYTVYVSDHLSPQKEANADARRYHLFFVIHAPEEENPAFRGVWSISIVEDALYQQKGFSFAARPDTRGQEQGTSPCGIFAGEEALTLADALPTPQRAYSYDETITGPGYQTGPVTVQNDAGEAPQKYSEETAKKIEDCLNGRDEKQLKDLYSRTILDVRPKTEQEIHSLLQLFTGSSDSVRITETEETQGTGATSMSYLLDSEGDNHIQPGFGTYYP
ncbi:hypothetical protein SAMN02745687_02377 [Lachnospiraceae bacterium NK3A20]|nr:hypothetical protein SAMN02745687_02377 [Lachnospiraceae bacterium NK3A20]